MTLESNIADRRAAEALHRLIGELLRDEIPKLPSGRARELFWGMMRDSVAKNLGAEPPKPSEQKPTKPKRKPLHITHDSSVDEAEGLVNEICEMADSICTNGQDFGESCRERAESIWLSVEDGGHATDGQLEALGNMAEGLRRWFHD